MGYQAFVVIWRVNGQYRYEERHWRQQEEMFLLHPYHTLEWSRRNCTVNPYHGSLGKNHIAYDEALELANRFFAQFPKVRDRDAFARQGNYIGLAKMCKRFLVDLLKMREDTEQVVYRTGSKPECTLERTMIYEMFVKLETSGYKPGRKFDRFYVKNVVTKLDTVLSDTKIEARIKGKQDDEAYAHFSSIGQIYDDVELAHIELMMRRLFLLQRQQNWMSLRATRKPG